MAGKKKDENKSYDSNWGGRRQNSGRKRKGELIKLRELLDEQVDSELVAERLVDLIENGDLRAIELYLKYRVGSPKQEIDINHSGSTEFRISDVINRVGFEDTDESE